MNKKCGLCEFFSDKCKNPENPNYNKFRYFNKIDHKDSRCSGFKNTHKSPKEQD